MAWFSRDYVIDMTAMEQYFTAAFRVLIMHAFIQLYFWANMKAAHIKIVKHLIFRENVFLFRLMYGKKEVMS